jgi:hypothetical protein
MGPRKQRWRARWPMLRRRLMLREKLKMLCVCDISGRVVVSGTSPPSSTDRPTA